MTDFGLIVVLVICRWSKGGNLVNVDELRQRVLVALLGSELLELGTGLQDALAAGLKLALGIVVGCCGCL